MKTKDLSKIGLGGSCHWCTEAVFQSLYGVQKVEQGWISSKEHPSLSEAVVLHFDKTVIDLPVLIQIHLHTHSCTSEHSMREKYRSAIYVFDDTQFKNAHVIIKDNQEGFSNSIITQVLYFEHFKTNTGNFLNYYYTNVDKPFCKNVINPKLKQLIASFSRHVNQQKTNHLHEKDNA